VLSFDEEILKKNIEESVVFNVSFAIIAGQNKKAPCRNKGRLTIACHMKTDKRSLL